MAPRAKKKPQLNASSLGKAIAHPLRLRVLTILTEREASAIQMSRNLCCESTEVSYHIKVLKNLDFVEEVGQAQRRGATERFYRAVSRPMVDAAGLAQLPTLVANSFIGQAMQGVIDDFQAAADAGLFAGQDDLQMSRYPMLLDAEGQQEVLSEHDALLQRLMDIQARSDERRAKSGEDGRRIISAQMCFEAPADSAS